MRPYIIFTSVCFLLLICLGLELLWGTVSISPDDVLSALIGGNSEDTATYLVRHYRLPKALMAILTGSGISICGLMMQNLFRNPLADTSILGIGSGAGLGVAVYTMAFALFPSYLPLQHTLGGWGMVVAAFIGAGAVLLIITAVASWLRDMIAVLIVGVMLGFMASSLIAVLQFFSDEQMLKGYLLWSFASLSGTSWGQLTVLSPAVLIGLGIVYLMPKYMNAMNLGEQYTRSLGINPQGVRLIIILTTSLISGAITAFAGPIAFLGIAVPHFTRILFRTADHRILIPATMLTGATLMLICDLLSQVPGYSVVLPINAITSLIGAPVVIMFIARSRRKQSIFN